MLSSLSELANVSVFVILLGCQNLYTCNVSAILSSLPDHVNVAMFVILSSLSESVKVSVYALPVVCQSL